MKTQTEELEKLTSPEEWPQWPMLPMKRPGIRGRAGFPQVGVVVDPQLRAGEWAVVLTNMFSLVEGSGPIDFNDYQQKRYDTPQQLLADGWVID